MPPLSLAANVGAVLFLFLVGPRVATVQTVRLGAQTELN